MKQIKKILMIKANHQSIWKLKLTTNYRCTQ